MSVAKIIEISAQSNQSFDEAIREGIRTASRTVKNIKGAWVKDQEIMIENGEIRLYRVTLKITFILDE